MFITQVFVLETSVPSDASRKVVVVFIVREGLPSDIRIITTPNFQTEQTQYPPFVFPHQRPQHHTYTPQSLPHISPAVYSVSGTVQELVFFSAEDSDRWASTPAKQ